MHRARFVVAVLATVGLTLVTACSGSAVDNAGAPLEDPSAEPCQALTNLALIDMRITTAEMVPAGDTPAHCRVAGIIETEINFELLLPVEWNGRFMMGGGGGFVGSVQNAALNYGQGPGALERGYATAGTDTGHVGSGIDASWALDNVERQENFGHRAVHLTAEAAKSIIRHYYDRAPDYSYFVGCSRGGGQGMMESQRYPDDFDGIVAGAPAYHWTALTAGMVQTQQALYPDGDLSQPVLTPDAMSRLAQMIDAACDARDGVEDGVLNDPRLCDFSVDDLPTCRGDEPGPSCFTSAQLAALETIYGGPTSNGEPIFAGFPIGDESDAGGWDTWITGSDASRERGTPSLHFAFGTGLYTHFVFGDPEWDYSTYDFSTWRADTAAVGEMLNATDTDLSAFDERGGKLILWTGWSDPAITALGTIDYYEAVEADDPDVRDYVRLFMLPGVLHCGGGPGPSEVDWVEAIRTWVEEGEAPERLIAHKVGNDAAPTVTRPVCPYPQIAAYDGEGDPNQEGSFACVVP